MKVQAGDFIRINQDNANLASGVKRGDVFEVDHVWEDDQYDRVTVKAREDRNNREWVFRSENYELIAHAAKPETPEAGETFTEIAKRLCEFRNCDTCPVGAGRPSRCAVSAARFEDVDAQIRAARAWAAENPPTPKPVNRVLTMCEVYALPEGAEVWGEERNPRLHPSKTYTRKANLMLDGTGKYYDLNSPTWSVFEGRHDFRFWSLPQPPTEAEKAANPW